MLLQVWSRLNLYLTAFSGEDGQALSEYGLILLLVVIALIIVLSLLKDSIAPLLSL